MDLRYIMLSLENDAYKIGDLANIAGIIEDHENL